MLNSRSFGRLLGVAILATVWTAALQIGVTPIYLHRLGVEAFALIAFYVTLLAVLTLFDAGVSITVSRDVAHLVAEKRFTEVRDVVRTFEAVYWTTGLVISGSLVLASSWIANVWLRDTTLPRSVVRHSVMLMALLWMAQWFVSYYQAAMIGMERIVAVNVARMIGGLLQHGGSALLLFVTHIGPAGVFAWQASVMAGVAIVLSILFWRGLPRGERAARVSVNVVRQRWRFSIGIGGMTIVGVALSQADKVILSHILPLRVFASYSLGSVIAGAALLMVIPAFNVLLPRLTSLVATRESTELLEIYRTGCQVVAVIAAAPAAFICFFGRRVIVAWTGMPDLAATTAPVAALLIAGTALNAMTFPPYALQLAHGRTRAWFWINFAQLFAFVPLVAFFGMRFGIVAAAAVWPCVQAAALLTGVPLSHVAIFASRGAMWLRDVLPPIIAGAAAAAVMSVFPIAPRLPLAELIWLACAAAVTALAAAFASPRMRTMLRSVLTSP